MRHRPQVIMARREGIMARYARALAVIATLASFGALAQAPADSYPNHAVKILVPYSPGGVTDIIARLIAPRLQEVLGQAFVVENKPGASGNIALEAVAAAPPDGYTLFVGNVTTNAINENTFADKLQMKPSRALVGLSRLGDTPHMVVANPDFPAGNSADPV